jgi:hypothetical protein
MTRVPAKLESRRRLDPPRVYAAHPHHRSLAQTIACIECMRRFWEAQAQLERRILPVLTDPRSIRMVTGPELTTVVR